MWKWSCSVVSDSQRPHGLQPTRLLHPWDFQARVLEWAAIAFSDLRNNYAPKRFTAELRGKTLPILNSTLFNDTEQIGSPETLEGAILILEFSVSIFWSESLVAQSGPTLCKPMDCSLPGSSVLRIFQTRVLEWVAISFSRGSSWPRDWTRVSHIVGTLLSKPPGKHILQSAKFIGYLRGGKGLKPNKFWILST